MSKPDWEAIESAYRAGVLSVRELAGKYGISHQAISKRAKKDGWERDLKAKVQAKAQGNACGNNQTAHKREDKFYNHRRQIYNRPRFQHPAS